MKSEIIPVIHVVSREQVLSNVATCVKCGIQKIFLINHVVAVEELIMCAYIVKIKYMDLWIGINMLGMDPVNALSMQLPSIIKGLWMDETVDFPKNRVRSFKGMVFGGLAFKYQPQPLDLVKACEVARVQTDVATTSGPGTGKAANVEKIKLLREYLGDHPMAIASGISAENIHNYKGLADYLLVASSITDKNEMIIEEKLMELKSKL